MDNKNGYHSREETAIAPPESDVMGAKLNKSEPYSEDMF